MTTPDGCPACGVTRITAVEITLTHNGVLFHECDSCGHRWTMHPPESDVGQAAAPWVNRGLLQPGDME